MRTYAFLWNEYEAKKGSCEIATSVMKFLQVVSKKSDAIFLFCDKCDRQNCNRMVLLMLCYCLNLMAIERVELTFPVPGHSQNENDTAHCN